MGKGKEMKIKVHYNVECPRVPNFLLLSKDSDEKIPICAITEEGLREIGKQWTENLVARAKQMGWEKSK